MSALVKADFQNRSIFENFWTRPWWGSWFGGIGRSLGPRSTFSGNEFWSRSFDLNQRGRFWLVEPDQNGQILIIFWDKNDQNSGILPFFWGIFGHFDQVWALSKERFWTGSGLVRQGDWLRGNLPPQVTSLGIFLPGPPGGWIFEGMDLGIFDRS